MVITVDPDIFGTDCRLIQINNMLFLFAIRSSYYRPRERVGKGFTHVYISVRVHFQVITFKHFDLLISFVAHEYITTISRLSLNIKAIGLRSKSHAFKNIKFSVCL